MVEVIPAVVGCSFKLSESNEPADAEVVVGCITGSTSDGFADKEVDVVSLPPSD